MATAATPALLDPTAGARHHALMRLAVGITAAFVIAEAKGWTPTFLPAVLLTVLLTSLPVAPPLKSGVILVIVMAFAVGIAFAFSSILRGSPIILFGAIGLVIFLAFLATAHQRAKLPALLLLISISTIPVTVMVAPDYGGLLPVAMIRGMAVALLIIWVVFAVWPEKAPGAPPASAGPIQSPLKMALVGTAIVLPVVLTHLLFGLADALPVLVTTVLIVVNFDVRRGALHGLVMIAGNLIGGLIGIAAFLLLAVSPSLVLLALITFLLGMNYAFWITKGGPVAAVATMASNATWIIFGSALASGASSSGILATRLLQFAIACIFAIGMMILVWGKTEEARPEPQ